jgi:polyferredoxin
MKKVGRSARLIAYDTDVNIKRRQQGQTPLFRLVRTRTVLYTAIIALVGAVMIYTLATRRNDGISIIHDRNPLFVRLSDGALRNAFAVRILNKMLEPQSFVLKVAGLADAGVDVIGSATRSGGDPIIEVGPDQSREVRVLVTTHQRFGPGASVPLTFTIAPEKGGTAASAGDHFLGP